MAAAGGGHSGVVDILLQQQQREDVNICENDDGQFALWAASEKGHASVVQSLIKNNANVNQVTKLGQSSLWIASCNGHAATVDCLLTNGADANQVSAFDGSMVSQDKTRRGMTPPQLDPIPDPISNPNISWPSYPLSPLVVAMDCRNNSQF